MKILIAIGMMIFVGTWFVSMISSMKRYLELKKQLQKNGWLGYFPGPR